MIGHTVSHYKILEKLGEGGMGEVFLAEDTKLGRKTALKFLPVKTSADNDARRRFEREARAAAALNHPNIVTIYEIDEFEDRVYIAMEYVEGVTLRERITFLGVQLSDSGDEETALLEMMPVDELIDIALQICAGLDEAHRLGIIHRDIKLQNILVDKNNRVKILDFGLAKLKGASKITGEISRVGTIYYMSPEQAQGEEVDLRTDIWSLGVVLYELVTGRPPFKGDYEQAVIRAIIHDSPQPPSEMRDHLPRALEKIIFKCLCKNRGDRYSSAQALKEDLEKLRRSLGEETQEPVPEFEEKLSTTKETERRQATVLFAELFGGDRVLKKLDAEEAASLMKTCFEMFGSIVEKYGGSIDRIMGSGLTALFGVPAAMEDAPKSAVNAAIEMRKRLYQFNREKDLPSALDIRIGINTGMVIAGSLGPDEKGEYSVVGETVTFADRLKSLAKKGTVYIGPLTYKYTRDQFQYKELKLVSLTGKAKSAAVFKLLSSQEKIHRPRLEPGRITDSIMVGREKELDKLKLHLLKVINAEGSIVSITGEAGMGKTRLLAELKKSEDFGKVLLLEGRALSFGHNLSYHPFIDILKNWAGMHEGESQADSLARLERAVSETCGETGGEIFPFIAVLMGMSPTGKHLRALQGIEDAAMEKLILKSMRRWLIKCAEQRPVVFAVEDLHWADISSIELLESLFRTAENQSILFINVLRPGHEKTGDRILETADMRFRAVHTVIPLEPLGEADCKTIIRSLAKVDMLSSGIVAAVTQRAEGNPSFVEEIARSFMDSGKMEAKEGDIDLTDKIETLVIPKTIRDVLMVRIDRLDESTRTLVKEASVIGRSFSPRVLAEITETGGDIRQKLERLKEKQIIGERTRLGEDEYYFKHALAREAAYESLLLKKRKELHLKTAAAIETVFPGRQFEFYGLLALHYSRGENLEKAEDYLLKAGEEALKAAASSEALAYYREALELYQKKYAAAADPEKIALLEKNIARACYNKGRMTEAVRHFDNLLELWGEKRAKHTLPVLLHFLLDMLIVVRTVYFPSKRPRLKPSQRDNDIFEAAYLRGTALGFTDPHRMFRDTIHLLKNLRKYDPSQVSGGVLTWSLAAGIFFFSGLSFAVARKLLDYTRPYISADNWRDRFTFDLFQLSLDTLTGRWDRSTACDISAVDKSVQAGELFIAPLHLLLCAFLEQERGRFTAVPVYSDKLNYISETYENDSVRVIRHLLLARFFLQRRELPDALRETENGIQLSGRTGHEIFLLIFHGLKADIQVLQGDMKEAGDSLKLMEQMIAREKTVTPVHISSYRLSRYLFDICILEKRSCEGDRLEMAQAWENARRSGRKAVKTAEKCAIFRTETFRLRGLYYWLTGRQKKALAWWGRSIHTGHRQNAAPELARTYMEIGRRLAEKKSKYRQWKGLTAAEYLKNARRLFESMGIEWDLRILDKNDV